MGLPGSWNRRGATAGVRLLKVPGVAMRHLYRNVRARWAVQASRDEVSAVDSRGLERLLEKTGMRRKFERGDISCKFCRQPVDESVFYAFVKDSGTVKAVCSKPQCVAQLVEWIEER